METCVKSKYHKNGSNVLNMIWTNILLKPATIKKWKWELACSLRNKTELYFFSELYVGYCTQNILKRGCKSEALIYND